MTTKQRAFRGARFFRLPAHTAPLLLALLLTLQFNIAGAQTSSPRASAAQIKANLSRILADPEFQTARPAESVMNKLLRAIVERWDKFLEWFNRLFHISAIGGGSAGLQWVFIALFIALGAWLLAGLIRSYVNNRAPKAPARRTTYDLDEADATDVAEPDVWLEQAQVYAKNMDYRRAYRAVFMAILLRLDRGGFIEYTRARTNGDYVRALRLQKLDSLHALLQTLSGEFDARWYGDRATDADDYRACRVVYDQIAQQTPLAASSGRVGSQTGALLAGRA